MKVMAMATENGNELVERIANAAARMQVVQGATSNEALNFMDKSLATLSCANEFFEAYSARVRMDAVHRYQKLVKEFESEMANS